MDTYQKQVGKIVVKDENEKKRIFKIMQTVRLYRFFDEELWMPEEKEVIAEDGKWTWFAAPYKTCQLKDTGELFDVVSMNFVNKEK